MQIISRLAKIETTHLVSTEVEKVHIVYYRLSKKTGIC